MQVRHHHAQANASIGEQFVQPVFFACEYAAKLLPVAGNVTQTAQVRFGNEGGAQQARACQRGQPLRIRYISLSTWHSLDVTGVDHPGDDANTLQRRIRASSKCLCSP